MGYTQGITIENIPLNPRWLRRFLWNSKGELFCECLLIKLENFN